MKKRIMRLFPVLLALVMVFGSSLTVFAATVKADKTYFTDSSGNKVFIDDYLDISSLKFYQSDTYTNYQEYVVSCEKIGDTEEYYLMYFPKGEKVYRYDKEVSVGVYCSWLVTDQSHNPYCFKVTKDLETSSYHFFDFGIMSVNLANNVQGLQNAKDTLSAKILYSSVNIYDSKEDSAEVFIPALSALLATVVKPKTMEGALDQILIILPICLVCLVGYLALRKALAVLQSLLHQA